MINVQKWLDKKHPKGFFWQSKRSKVREIYLNEPSLEGELDLRSFAYSKYRTWGDGVRVYIFPLVDETKLTFKNLPEEVWIVLQARDARANIDYNYPTKQERKKITKLYISDKKLEGNLDLSDFVNLRELNCSLNNLTSLNLTNCRWLERIYCSSNLLNNFTLPTNPINLKILDLSNNNFPTTQDLFFLKRAINLEYLYLENRNYIYPHYYEKIKQRINQGIYNRFTGSLDYLSGVKKLKKLNISNTDINGVQIDKLPRSLEKIYYSTEERLECKLTEIVPLLEKCKWGFCQNCWLANTSEKWCQLCVGQEWQKDLERLSEQRLIEKFIWWQPTDKLGIKGDLKWIPYEKFTDIEYLAEGGFSKIYKAKQEYEYEDKYESWESWHYKKQKNLREVVLKSLNNSENTILEFLQEITNTGLVKSGSNTARYHGISQDSETKNYLMVMDYMEYGNLRDYLKKQFRELSWKDKLEKLKGIAYGLDSIHSQGLVHRDLHSGNILNEKYCSYITELGLSQLVNHQKKVGKIFGVLPYVAPELLQGKPYTKASDIYSFGMIMHEMLTGLPPYYDIPHNEFLAIRICQGLRPQFQIKMPSLLEDLINRCWNADLLKRPSAEKLERILSDWHEEIRFKKNTQFTQQLQEVEEYNQTLLKEIRFPKYVIHPHNTYTSKMIDTKQISEKLMELSQSVSFSMTELQEALEEMDKQEKNDKDRTNIRSSFTDKLIKKWQELGFTYQQTQDWINTGLQPTDYNFCDWLRDVKKVDAEWVINHGNLEQLNQEFFTYWQSQQQIQQPPK